MSCKIVFVTNALYSHGGVEQVTVLKANALSSFHENRVWIITCSDDSSQPRYPLSDGVRFRNIQSINNRRFPWNWFWLIPELFHLKREIRRVLRQIEPDIVISTGGISGWVLPFIKGRWTTVREINTATNFRLLSSSNLTKKIRAYISTYFDTDFICKRYDRIVVLTQEEKRLWWSKNEKVVVIPNPFPFKSRKKAELKNKRIIAVGRLEYQKNFTSLIRAFSIVAGRYPEWRLDIYGDGNERKQLSGLISDMSLEGIVSLKGITNNIEKEMLQSSMIVLSSRTEGLPMVLIEAISYGLPVVSYACPCGPKDIITDGVNGFLVPVGDEALLAERICRLIEDKELRKHMGCEAFKSSSRYEMSTIIQQWINFYDSLIPARR